MTRYIVLPTLLVFALGLGAGWALRGGRSTPRDVWVDAGWWSKGFGDGLAIRRLNRTDVSCTMEVTGTPLREFVGWTCYCDGKPCP